MKNRYKFTNFLQWLRILKDVIYLDAESELYILYAGEGKVFGAG